MRRGIAVVVLAVFALCASAGAVEFGADLGTRVTDVLPAGYYSVSPLGVRGGAFDLLADVPLSRVFSVNFRVGGFTGTDAWKAEDRTAPAVNLFALDGRVALFATAPIVRDRLDVYVGVGATFDRVSYWNADVPGLPYRRLTKTGLTLGVPAGLKVRLSRRFEAGFEMEVPDQGWYSSVIEESPEAKHTLSWSQYGTVEPSVSAALYFVR
jgi:hypothetical protein